MHMKYNNSIGCYLGRSFQVIGFLVNSLRDSNHLESNYGKIFQFHLTLKIFISDILLNEDGELLEKNSTFRVGN